MDPYRLSCSTVWTPTATAYYKYYKGECSETVKKFLIFFFSIEYVKLRVFNAYRELQYGTPFWY
jgi:hypothetical protein